MPCGNWPNIITIHSTPLGYIDKSIAGQLHSRRYVHRLDCRLYLLESIVTGQPHSHRCVQVWIAMTHTSGERSSAEQGCAPSLSPTSYMSGSLASRRYWPQPSGWVGRHRPSSLLWSNSEVYLYAYLNIQLWPVTYDYLPIIFDDHTTSDSSRLPINLILT